MSWVLCLEMYIKSYLYTLSRRLLSYSLPVYLPAWLLIVQEAFGGLEAVVHDHSKLTCAVLLTLLVGFILAVFTAVHFFIQSIKVCPAIVIAHVDITHAKPG
jgi:hypothetical protein